MMKTCSLRRFYIGFDNSAGKSENHDNYMGRYCHLKKIERKNYQQLI